MTLKLALPFWFTDRCSDMTFDELFAEHNLTADERLALVMHLATVRALATLRALMKPNV